MFNLFISGFEIKRLIGWAFLIVTCLAVFLFRLNDKTRGYGKFLLTFRVSVPFTLIHNIYI